MSCPNCNHTIYSCSEFTMDELFDGKDSEVRCTNCREYYIKPAFVVDLKQNPVESGPEDFHADC